MNCFGPAVKDSTAPFEFTYVTTEKGRVDGFDLALRRGTAEVRAELSKQIEAAIRACGGNMTEAAKRLGISSKTIYRKRQEWDGVV